MLYPKQNVARNLMRLDGFWQFEKDTDDIGEIEKWYSKLPSPRDIAVPGSWNEQYSDLYRYMGKGWYYKKVFVPKSWEDSIWLRIGSVFYKAKVWVNGVYQGEHEGGHLPFEFDITSAAKKGEENHITIMVDSSLDPWGLPPAALDSSNEARVGFFNSNPPVTYDFYPYGGIHRPVYLYTTNECRIEEIKIETVIEDTKAFVYYSIELSKGFTGELEALCGSLKMISSLHDKGSVKGHFEVVNPTLWDMDNPHLYDAIFNLVSDDEIVDSYTQTFGIRTIEISGNQLLLNGKEVFLNGFGKHEDFHIIGKGLNPSLIVKDFDLIKWIGGNSFRTSHYPYAEEMLDYADRHGVLVIAETPFVGLNERMYKSEIFDKAKTVIEQMIKRDWNHPSIIMWSLANEPTAQSKEAEKFFEGMAITARRLDDIRPITYVAHLETKENIGMKYYDIICLNKYYGWYISPGMIDEMLPEFEKCMDRFYDEFKKPMIIAEFGADAIAGMHSEPALMFSEEFQAEMLEKQYELIRSKEYCIGAHIWNFADFRTAESISRIIFNRKGLFTRERQPKLAAHCIRRIWKAQNEKA